MFMFRQIRQSALWLFDWYCRLETIGKWIVGIGFVGAGVTSGLTFLTTVARGLDPLLGIFFAVLALLLVGMVVLVVMEITGTRIPPKTIRLHDRVLAAHTGQFAVSGAQAAPSSSTAPKPIGYGDDHVSLQDATMYVINRRWPLPEEKLPDDKTGQPAMDAITAMREAACHQQMRIYGIEYNGQLPGPIDSEYWRNHQIDYLTVMYAETPASVKTESAISLREEKIYKHLLVLKSEVEALWPPA